jgi:zinc protease
MFKRLPGKRSNSSVFMVCGLSLCLAGCATFSTAPQDLPIKAVQYESVKPTEWSLENGLSVLFYRDAEIPTVSSTLYLKGGSLHAPEFSPSTVLAMGGQMREGGAGDYSDEGMDKELERYAASVTSSYGAEFGSVGMHCLTSDVDKVFDIFASVVLKPKFSERRLSLWKSQSAEGIRRRADDPTTIASIAFNTLLYGKNSPYSFYPEVADIQKVSREQLEKAHHQLVRPNGAILVITGDIEEAAARKLVQEKFSNWTPSTKPLAMAPAVTESRVPGIYFIEAPFEQATIVAGHLGVPRLTEDHVAINAFNRVFGTEGFGSRLTIAIREKKGLAYVTYGAILPDVVKGKNLFYVQTKAKSAGDSLVEGMATLRELQQKPVPAEELELLKSAEVSSFIFKVDNPAEAVQRLASQRLLGYPADYDKKLVEELQALGANEIQKVANSRWNPDELVVVLVGNKTAYEQLIASIKRDGEAAKELGQLPLETARFTTHLVLE